MSRAGSIEKPIRSLILIEWVIGDTVGAYCTQWRDDVMVTFPLSTVPLMMRASLARKSFLVADVNIEADRAEDLRFTNFELPVG